MTTKSLVLKPSKKIILPEDVPVGKALKLGLAIPARRSQGKRLPVVPAGMGVFAKWALQVLDKRTGKFMPFRDPKSGKMVRKIEGPSHSFTRNFAFLIRGFLQNLDSALNLNETLTDDTGAAFLCRMKTPVITPMTGTLPVINGLAKMKFGNSSAALSTTQTDLQGVLLGPITEDTVVVTLVVEDTTNTIFTVQGQVTNGTGGAFTVEEMGVFPELNDTLGNTDLTTMCLRDLTGSVAVANGLTIIGTYTFTIAV